ncbi:unnamed protein product [Vitrella brassicaformis CCMP3155]|uniref:Uncharacterized protein n=2 Tax=Vitrella brassicaformis TaxID=1169539 RepID=A0A0G4G708_VITBC|nr:unnamed protein product [Vitrella brassicaformis CCMP3155]|mmetsp:Transcript_17028/g.40917  ORF Transcript_17028/g.40917 Transcript_17028/m.40917 type:complete len:110 (+) Transcript_17028:159-488(+)|eukprot:CEM24495.1 unnamed protein product [Vitrella brassicaformis CCMP3155]
MIPSPERPSSSVEAVGGSPAGASPVTPYYTPTAAGVSPTTSDPQNVTATSLYLPPAPAPSPAYGQAIMMPGAASYYTPVGVGGSPQSPHFVARTQQPKLKKRSCPWCCC